MSSAAAATASSSSGSGAGGAKKGSRGGGMAAVASYVSPADMQAEMRLLVKDLEDNEGHLPSALRSDTEGERERDAERERALE